MPINGSGDRLHGGTETLAQAWMCTGRVDVKLPPSTYFARNVLVTAPAMKIAYKWCKMGGKPGHQLSQVPLPRPTDSPSCGCSADVRMMNFHGFSEAVAKS